MMAARRALGRRAAQITVVALVAVTVVAVVFWAVVRVVGPA